MAGIVVPGAAQAPIYRREEALPTPLEGIGKSVSEAGRSMGEYARQQQKVKTSYDQMVQARQQAIMADRRAQRQMDETERANQAKEVEDQRKHKIEERHKADKMEQERGFKDREVLIKEAEEKERMAYETKWTGFRDKLMERMEKAEESGRPLNRQAVTDLGDLYGVTTHPDYKNFIEARFPKPPSSFNIGLGHQIKKDEGKQNFINATAYSRSMREKAAEISSAPPERIKKLVKQGSFAGIPIPPELMEMDDYAARTAMVKLVTQRQMDYEKLASQSLAKSGYNFSNVPQDWVTEADESYKVITDTNSDPVSPGNPLEKIMLKIEAQEKKLDSLQTAPPDTIGQ